MILDTAKFEVFQKNSYYIFIQEINPDITSKYRKEFELHFGNVKCIFKNFLRVTSNNINRGYSNEGFLVEVQFGGFLKDKIIVEDDFREKTLNFLQDFANKKNVIIMFRANTLTNGLPDTKSYKITKN